MSILNPWGTCVADTTRPELLENVQRALAEGVRPFDRKLSDAWDEFFGIYNRILRRFAMRLLRCPDDVVDDVVATVWLDVLKQLPAFQYDPARGRFRSWLYRLLQRRMIDEFRKRGRQLRVVRNGLNSDFWSNCLDPRADAPEAELQRVFEKEMAEEVVAVYRRRAPEKERQVVEVCLVQDGKPSQAAEQLELSDAATRQALHRGRMRIAMIRAELFGTEMETWNRWNR
jgi:RNA polymerase sigma factor (sigma-70 family)